MLNRNSSFFHPRPSRLLHPVWISHQMLSRNCSLFHFFLGAQAEQRLFTSNAQPQLSSLHLDMIFEQPQFHMEAANARTQLFLFSTSVQLPDLQQSSSGQQTLERNCSSLHIQQRRKWLKPDGVPQMLERNCSSFHIPASPCTRYARQMHQMLERNCSSFH